MNSALKQSNPKTAATLSKLEVGVQRAVALSVAKLAVTMNEVHEDLVTGAFENQEFGDLRLREALQTLADKIEAPYLAALDNDVNIENDPKLLSKFKKARAVIALYFALSDKPEIDAANSIYESLHAGVTVQDVQSAIESLSSKS
jgi:hypothetical protein